MTLAVVEWLAHRPLPRDGRIARIPRGRLAGNYFRIPSGTPLLRRRLKIDPFTRKGGIPFEASNPCRVPSRRLTFSVWSSIITDEPMLKRTLGVVGVVAAVAFAPTFLTDHSPPIR